MLLPSEKEKKVTTNIAVAKGKKMARKGRNQMVKGSMDHADEEYGSMEKVKKGGKKGKKGKKAKC